MPVELVVCIFISGIAIMIGLTVHVHRQRKKILDISREQEETRTYINAIKHRINSDSYDDSLGLGRLGVRGDDQEPERTDGP